jgi:capsular exopolysaccharide synthesis family protein
MAALNSDYMRLQSQYDYLSNIYGSKHHKMVALNTEIRGLADRIALEQSKIKSGEIDGSLTNEKEGEGRKLLEEILNRIQDVSVRSSSQMNNVVVADLAVPPKEIALPKKNQAILIGFLASLLVGIFLAFLIEFLDDTIKDRDELKKVIGGAIFLGAVPFDETVKGFNRALKMDRLMMHRPLSGSAESYRLIRVHLQWFMDKDPSFKDFAMVSSIPGEGKSTVSSNLAVSIAQLEKRVLLVDADVRRGRLHRTYGMRNKKGLGQYLLGTASFEDILHETSTPSVWMIAPGENHMLGSELLSSPKMLEFIRNTRRHFDMVIYDTPPLTLISDTSILLSRLYGAILVCRTGVTRSRDVPKSLTMIRSTETQLLGVVLNGSKANENNKYYNMYYRD